jgi:hypothetical protein
MQLLNTPEKQGEKEDGGCKDYNHTCIVVVDITKMQVQYGLHFSDSGGQVLK